MQKCFMVHGEDERLANLIDKNAIYSDEIISVTYQHGKISGSIRVVASFKDGGYETCVIPIINLNNAFDSHVYSSWIKYSNSTSIKASPKYYECVTKNPRDTLIARVDYPNATSWYKYKEPLYDKGYFKSVAVDYWIDSRLGTEGFSEILSNEYVEVLKDS